jgi:hypothetical protein
MGRPTVGQTLALAPDALSASAGQRLAVATAWSGLGHDDRAVWGACRGSGRAPYQVACDSWGPAYRCTCPSRKFPCKHAIALLLLWAREPPAVAAAAPPAEVGAWLASRATMATPGALERVAADGALARVDEASPDRVAPEVGSGAGAAGGVVPEVDPEAVAARAAKRVARIVAGMEELDRWLHDLVRQGLGRAPSLPYAFWDDMGARLVDAQAPGAAARVRNLAGVVRSGEGWPARLLAQMARLHLLAAGWRHLDSLPEPVRADLRTAAGWPWPAEEILAAGPRQRDRWYVLARSVTDDERVRAQRSWLWGLESGRIGVLVDFARPGATFSWELWPGSVLDAEIARYPGSAPLRVLVAERYGESESEGAPPGWGDLGEVAAARGRALAADPWLPRWPVSLTAATPDGEPGAWRVVDRAGRQMPLATDDHTAWKLLAVSGGHPVALLGEWEEDRLRPLGVWVDDEMVVL